MDLEQILCFQYFVTFKDQTLALFDSECEVNAINSTFACQLGPKIQQTNVGAQKINGTTLETYAIVVSIFFILDKDGRERFFEKSFFLTHAKPDIILEMLFLTLSNANIDFQAQNS